MIYRKSKAQVFSTVQEKLGTTLGLH